MEEYLVLGASEEEVGRFFEWYRNRWGVEGEGLLLQNGKALYRGVVVRPEALSGLRPDVIVLLDGALGVRGIFLELHILQVMGTKVVISDSFENPQ